MHALPTQLRLALIALALVFLGCSDVSEPSNDTTATSTVGSGKSEQDISGLTHNQNVDEFIHNGSLTPTDFFLFEGQDLVVYVPLSLFSSPDPTLATAVLNGVYATQSVLVRGNADFNFMDYADDDFMAFVFEASTLPPSTQKNTFTVKTSSATIVEDKSFTYGICVELPIEDLLIAEGTVAWLDASSNKIYPSGLILKENGQLTVIISHNTPGSFEDFDFSAASLQGAGESHVDLGHGSGWLNGINGMRVRHFKETADGETGHIIMHFDVSELDASKDGFYLDYYGKLLSFFAQHRSASRNTIELDFRDDGEWNFPQP